MPETHAARRDRLRVNIAAVGVEAALITRLVNIRYLTGFTGSNAGLLVTADHTVLATDGRYDEQSRRQAPDVERVIDRAVDPALLRWAVDAGIARVGFEAHDLSVELHEKLAADHPALSLHALGHAVEELRTVKDDEEIALLREACAIGDQALGELLGTVAPGRTEREIARELENRMLDHGADGVAFETIVATGPHSAVPHHRPTERAVERGDLLKIDFGALYQGYHADCTRTVVVGGPAADWQREVYQVVREAQQAGREALAPGVEIAAVDAAARDVVRAAGHDEHFPHGLGHGVGLEIHEAPLLAATTTGRLHDHTPVTVEPGVYLTGRGGVRIEDTLVVRASGPELLTVTPKDLLVL